jgi:putative CRISPR-associated protein (TIGR02619 family)
MGSFPSVRRIIICTTGTSIAQGVPALKDGQDAETYRQAIRNRLANLRRQLGDHSLFFRKLSAESNSLHRLRVNERDEVVLLHTETLDGQICAEMVKELVEEAAQLKVELVRIGGLQVDDAGRFRREGVQNLFGELHRRCGPRLDDEQTEIILNATGGFKSTVPYLTLYGLLYRLPVVYIFERSETLIWLPPAPVHFDYERLARAEAALRKLHRETGMKKEEFFRLIPNVQHHERPFFETLLEECDGEVTLSAFGLLLAEALAREQAQVLISPAAAKVYEQSQGVARDQFTRMLERVRDPLWRKQKRHAIQGTGLTVFKPGRTKERMACVVRGDKVYVCELFYHDYSLIEGKSASDYDLGTFVPWSRPADAAAPPDTDDELFACLEQEVEKWRKEAEQCRELWQETDARCEVLAADLRAAKAGWDDERRLREAAEARAARAEDELRRLGSDLQAEWRRGEERAAEVARLQQDLQACREELAAARRPWWQRLLGRRGRGR